MPEHCILFRCELDISSLFFLLLLLLLFFALFSLVMVCIAVMFIIRFKSQGNTKTTARNCIVCRMLREKKGGCTNSIRCWAENHLREKNQQFTSFFISQWISNFRLKPEKKFFFFALLKERQSDEDIARGKRDKQIETKEKSFYWKQKID